MKILNLIIPITMIATLFLPGCPDSRSQKLEQQITNLQQMINDFENKIKSLEKTAIRLEAKIDIENLERNQYKIAILDPSEKGFARVDTETGFFLISLKNVKPFLNGYKLVLNIGNPSSATYPGFTIKAKWGRKFDNKELESNPTGYDDWQKTLQEKKVSYTENLKPASWNKIELLISPAKSEELGYLEISMETDTIQLYK